MKFLNLLVCFVLAAAASATAQGTNDPGASLTSHGANPGLIPFFTSAQGSMVMEVGGAANSAFALLLGERTTTPFCPPLLNGECLLLETGLASIQLIVVLDGFQGSPFGQLDASGEADFAFPAAAFNGLTPAFQAVVQDPTNPPINVSLSAACEYEVSNVAVFSGDDVIVEYFFPSGTAYQSYGGSFTSVTVSTNGWVKFGGDCTFSDFSESTTDLINGTIGGAPGGAPIVAGLWNDLDLGNDPSQEVRIQEVMNGSNPELRVRWINADLFPATPFGTLDVTIRSNGVVEIDHTGINTSFTGGITGLSSGENAGGTTISFHDFYNGGFAPNSFNSSSFRNTIYQNFNISPDTPSSLYSLCFQPQNAFGSYDVNGVFLGQSCF